MVSKRLRNVTSKPFSQHSLNWSLHRTLLIQFSCLHLVLHTHKPREEERNFTHDSVIVFDIMT